MSIRRAVLVAYGLLLQLYPAAFRERFAGEMLQVAKLAEPGEWPLIFVDTCLAMVRCWLASPDEPRPFPAGQGAYLAVGESGLPIARILQGLVLAMVLVASLCYAGSLGYLSLPKCHAAAAEHISR